MKRLLAVSGVLVLVALILAGSVPSIQADGSPLPPPIPPLNADSPLVLLADGSPLPPPIPPVLDADRG